MHPATAARVAELHVQEMLSDVARERQAIRAERPQSLAPDPQPGPALGPIVAAVVAFLATAGIVFGGG